MSSHNMRSFTDFETPVDRQHFYFQFITTPTSDTPGTTLILHFNNKRYLFGRVAEGTQRAFNERGVSLKKSRNIFLTGETKWENNSGLLGMILTMADVTSESTEEQGQAALPTQIKILGGPKIWHSIACARRFIFRTGMPLRVYEADANSWKVSQQPDYFDENVLIWALPVTKRGRDCTTSTLGNGRSSSPDTVSREQKLRQDTVLNMFDSDWRKDKLYDAVFKEVNLPAMVWVRDPETKDLQATFCTKLEDAPHIQPDQKVFVRMPWPAALVEQLPPADNLPHSVSMSYFIKGRPQRGAFMPQKAKELGVPFGPSFGILANGRSITLDDGRMIKPEDVMDAVLPGPGMAILDVPHVDYLSDLHAKLSEMQAADVLKDTRAFMWILGPGVLHSERFANFRSQFPDLKHVVSTMDDAQDYLSMQSSGASATRLNQIRPEIFPIPLHNNDLSQSWNAATDLVRADRGMILHAAPRFEIARNEVPEILNIQEKAEGVSDTTKQLIPTAELSIASDTTYHDVSISTLGTGSAMPSKYRNVSANLVHIPSLGYFLLDAGENTLGQLRRSYSPEELEDVLCNLHMIWISHLHADHHLGTTSILVEQTKAAQRKRAAGQPLKHNLYLISERNMADYLEEYKSIESNETILLKCLNSELTDLNGQVVDLKDTTLPISKFDTTRVSHCHGAQAVSVTFSNGFKISYSGDCRPSKSFAEIGKDSDILIHEATFDDGMEGDAMAKKHCTIGEALGVAMAMKAKNVILTHFSQRYQKLPVLTNVKFPGQLSFEEGNDMTDDGPLEDQNPAQDYSNDTAPTRLTSTVNDLSPPILKRHTSLEAAAAEMSICIAFDLMRVTIPQIKDMYKYYPAIESMFEVEQMKSDARKAKIKQEAEEMNKSKIEATEAKRKANEMKKGDRPAKKKDKKKRTQSGDRNVNGTQKTSNIEE